MAEALDTQNPHLTGNNAAQYSEITANNREVVGETPMDLRGNFLPVGPNPYRISLPDIATQGEMKYDNETGAIEVHGFHAAWVSE